ncbi:hypothetical protein, partial [Streptomyces sp. NPDC014685]|uniref:hypothetical protein n=1 Tax=Streptomyces sp. NPDC014685 TaxID=3364881 RepID=UPI0036FD01F0
MWARTTGGPPSPTAPRLRSRGPPGNHPHPHKGIIMALKDILPGRLGFGTAPLGNMFRAIPDE